MDGFSILPAEIIADILTYLPAESILVCKLVSKTWKNIIQHPLFSKMHSDRLINQHYTDSGKLGFITLNTDGDRLYNVEYIENQKTPPIVKIRRINLKPRFKSIYTLVGSLNGLICLRDRRKISRFCISNPMTKEYAILYEPKVNFGLYDYHTVVGFGYVPSTNEYKVVVVDNVNKRSNFVEAMVYTLGSRFGWRHIGKFNLKFDSVSYKPGIFVNGALHWMDVTKGVIIIFDLADEIFHGHVSLPPLLTRSSLGLGVFGGFLLWAQEFYCSRASEYRYDIWLYKKKNDVYHMKAQNGHQSWGWNLEVTAATYSMPLAFTKSGGILGYICSRLDIFDPKTSSSKTLVGFEEQTCQLLPHTNTLLSLKELGEKWIYKCRA